MAENANPKKLLEPVRVVVTGASDPIGHQVALFIARGMVFGPDRPVHLTLVEANKKNWEKLTKGVSVELSMCILPLLGVLKSTRSYKEAFRDAQYIVITGGIMETEGFRRQDVLRSNCTEFKAIGQALDSVENRKVKTLVVTEPVNVNMHILCHFAPSIDRHDVTGLSMVQHNRSLAKLAKLLNTSTANIKRLSVLGNGGINMFPDLRHASLVMASREIGIYQAVGDDYYLKFVFVKDINHRGDEISKRLKRPMSLSVANAIIHHLKTWVRGTPQDDWTSMVVFSDGSYDVEKGLPFSFPVRVDSKGVLSIVEDLDMDFFERERIAEMAESVSRERGVALTTLNLTKQDEDGGDTPLLAWSFGCSDAVPCRVLAPLERQRMVLF